jgi:hypothetical protein
MSRIDSFVNTFFAAEDLRNKRQQLELMEQNSMMDRVNVAANISAMIANPEMRQSLGFVVGGDEVLQDEINQMLQAISPGAGVLQRFAAAQGFAALGQQERENVERIGAVQETTGLTPSGVQTENFLEQLMSFDEADSEELQRLARARRSVLATQQTPGQLARDLTVADMPPEDLETMERIAGGLDLSEMQKNQIAQWAASNHIQWADLAQRGALGTAGLTLQWQLAQMQAESGAMGPQFNPNTLLTTMLQAEERLRTEHKSLSDSQIANLVTVYNSAADNLSAMNLYPPAVRLDPNDLGKGLGFLRPFLFGSGGAVVGAGLGALVGHPGAGALIGGAVGGVGGAATGGREEISIPQQGGPAGIPPELLNLQGRSTADFLEQLRALGLITGGEGGPQ